MPLRILALGPQEAYPPTDGGKEGIYGALAALSRRAAITYVCPADARSPDARSAYAALGIHHVPLAHAPRETLATIVGATLRLKPFKFEKYASREAVRLCAAGIGTAQFDCILCFHAHTVGLAEKLQRRLGWKLPIIVREHNIEYELVESYRQSLSLAGRLVALPFALLTRLEEQSIWRRVNAAAFLTDRDVAAARSTGSSGNLVLAPEGVPLPAARLANKPTRDLQLLILLNQRAAQSVGNLRQFLHEYWPIASDAPALRHVSLSVTGVELERLSELTGVTPARLTALRVRALGFLPSLADAFATSLALVSPTFVGGGIRKKVLEAMANQLPVIATDLDIDSCGYFDPPQNILRLGSPADFVNCVEQLAGDAQLWSRLSHSGRQTVEQHASWELFADVISAEASRLASARNPHGPSR